MVKKISKEEMEKIIFEIGDLIHVKYKSKHPIPYLFGLGFSKIPLTPQEIIGSYEFKKEFEEQFPNLSKFILDNFKEAQSGRSKQS